MAEPYEWTLKMKKEPNEEDSRKVSEYLRTDTRDDACWIDGALYSQVYNQAILSQNKA